MIYKYRVQNIKGVDYVVESCLVAIAGTPTEPYEFTQPLKRELIDDDNHLRWTIRENPEYNPEVDHIDDRYIIEDNPIQSTSEELEVKKRAAVKSQLIAELPDIILQSKDNPEALVQALCDRAKQIEVENETGRDPKAVDPKVP